MPGRRMLSTGTAAVQSSVPHQTDPSGNEDDVDCTVHDVTIFVVI